MATEAPEAPRKSYESTHTLNGPSGDVAYTARAGWLSLRAGERERERAEVFYTYYRADSPGERPLTFVFNGGPGAASAFLHVGAIGPRRAVTNEDGSTPPPPAALTDNRESWLPFTDLVFVDPVGTGLSRTVAEKQTGDAPKEESPDSHYWNVDSDLDSLTEFFEVFLNTERRWGCPIYIAGESYGGYRAARLLRRAPEKAGIGISGAFLISPALEWEFLVGGTFDALYYALLAPTMAAAAHAHGRGGAGTSLSEHRAAAEHFALTELLPGITAATFTDGRIADALASKLSGFIGIDDDLCRKRAGRIDILTFVRELLRRDGKVVGLYDAAVALEDPAPTQPVFEGMDPSLGAQNHLYTTAANAHLRNGLGVDDQRRYHLLNMTVNEKWSFEDRSHPFHLLPAGATKDLAVGMAASPETKVVITHGVFDLVTPYFVSDYIVGLLAGQSPVASRIVRRHFLGGHMFYARAQSRAGLRDLAAETIGAP